MRDRVRVPLLCVTPVAGALAPMHVGASMATSPDLRASGTVRLETSSTEWEDAAGTHPVTPGQILPAREQLGDLLMELDRPAEALAAYERSLEAFPHRFNGHYGAARAGQLADRPEVARMHYAQLIEMAGDGDGRVEELAHAREYLKPR